MRIAVPPDPINSHFNLQKQEAVFEQVYSPDEDVLVAPAEVWSGKLHDLFCLAHDPAYVTGVRSGALVNGFGDFDERKVQHAEQSTLALLAAAGGALKAPSGGRVAFAPASGFHHASHAHGYGYCTFNGLMVTALALLAQQNMNILIVDGDGHYGEGTDDIIAEKRVHRHVRHLSLNKGAFMPVIRTVEEAAERRLTRTLQELEEDGPLPNLVLYQAGADAHKDDPYRAGYLSDAYWDRRDLALFKWCRRLDVPVAWCLAGGYNGLKTLNLHSRTFASALQVYEPGSLRLTFGQGPLSGTAEISDPPPSAPVSTHHA